MTSSQEPKTDRGERLCGDGVGGVLLVSDSRCPVSFQQPHLALFITKTCRLDRRAPLHVRRREELEAGQEARQEAGQEGSTTRQERF